MARAFLRFAFHHFYTTFAFTYDFVSAIVSRGQWHAWTRAAIPYIVGKRVLEVPCGTGNLLLDLSAAGFAPVGVDLSASMLNITHDKLHRAKIDTPILRARAQVLPFTAGAFDSITMTFPPSFGYDPHALAEMHRVLRDGGRLIWVDGGRLLPRDWHGRLLNTALDAVGGTGIAFAFQTLEQAGFAAKIEIVSDHLSQVSVIMAIKRAKNE